MGLNFSLRKEFFLVLGQFTLLQYSGICLDNTHKKGPSRQATQVGFEAASLSSSNRYVSIHSLIMHICCYWFLGSCCLDQYLIDKWLCCVCKFKRHAMVQVSVHSWSLDSPGYIYIAFLLYIRRLLFIYIGIHQNLTIKLA